MVSLLAILFTFSLFPMFWLIWKFKKSYVLIFIYFLVHVQVGSYIIDEYRERHYQAAMESPHQVASCGKFLNTSEIERGSKNSKWQQTLYHFELQNQKKLTIAYSDHLQDHVPNIQILDSPHQKVCLHYTPDQFDQYGYPLLTQLQLDS